MLTLRYFSLFFLLMMFVLSCSKPFEVHGDIPSKYVEFCKEAANGSDKYKVHQDCKGNTGCRNTNINKINSCYCSLCYDELCVLMGCSQT